MRAHIDKKAPPQGRSQNSSSVEQSCGVFTFI